MSRFEELTSFTVSHLNACFQGFREGNHVKLFEMLLNVSLFLEVEAG